MPLKFFSGQNKAITSGFFGLETAFPQFQATEIWASMKFKLKALQQLMQALNNNPEIMSSFSYNTTSLVWKRFN